MTANISIASSALSAEITPLGAELQRLTGASGEEYLWSGDPAVWSGRAPILFPIVGGLAGGRYRLDGREYALPKHGFARRREFALVETSASAVTFRLLADEETRTVFPFDFRLDLRFSVEGAALAMIAEVTNVGDSAMPVSFGFHPAFVWPLPGGGARTSHRIRFAEAEPDPIRRIDATGLVTDVCHPTPVEGRELVLRDDLFEDDALIFEHPRSRSLTYGARGGRVLDISWEGLPQLGIWTKPGAGYICVEPWQGHADPGGFAGDFRDKPGVIEVAPGETRRFVMTVTVVERF